MLKPVFIVLIIVLAYSCNKKIYSEKTSNSYSELVLVGKKHGQYRGLTVALRDLSGMEKRIFISLKKENCDSFYLSRFTLTSRRPQKVQHAYFVIARTGNMKVEFTPQETELLNKCRKTIDSLKWCNHILLTDAGSLRMTERK